MSPCCVSQPQQPGTPLGSLPLASQRTQPETLPWTLAHESCPSTWSELRACDNVPPELQFSYESLVFSEGEVFQHCALSELYIYPTGAFHSATHIVPASELQMLERWLVAWSIPEKERVVTATETSRKRKLPETSLPASSSDSVWMRDLLAVDKPRIVHSLDRAEVVEDGEEGAEGEDVEAAWEALELLREQTVVLEEANIDKFYRVSILGGEWFVRRSGRVVNSFRTDIRHDTYVHSCATPVSATEPYCKQELWGEVGPNAEHNRALRELLQEVWRFEYRLSGIDSSARTTCRSCCQIEACNWCNNGHLAVPHETAEMLRKPPQKYLSQLRHS
eukprot:3079209-Amphidinium_carterae.2